MTNLPLRSLTESAGPDSGCRSLARRFAIEWLGLTSVATAMVYLYGELSRAWTPIGGTKGQFLLLEVPLFLFVAWVGFVPLGESRSLRQRLVGWVLACVPPLVLLVFVDGFFAWLRRAPRFSDLSELSALCAASPALAAGIVVVLASTVLVPGWRLVLLKRAGSLRALTRWITPRLVGVVLFVVCTNWANPARAYILTTVREANWSEERALCKVGRLATTVFLSARKAASLERLQATKLVAAADNPFDRPVDVLRNVHLIVLESFVDPRLFDGVRFTSSPLHPRLGALLAETDGRFDMVTAPVYGGGTAQTEFELLTGLPALRRFGAAEFNSLEGHPVPSLVQSLRSKGYATVATVGTTGQFYNSPRAYQSLGFDEINFLDGVGYLESLGGQLLFDGDLLTQNLAHIDIRYLRPGRPIFNYVLGMYGHHPYTRDLAARPDVCRLVDGDGSSVLERVANQFYYRTGALADFVTALRERDPEAIVFVTSDHLPPLLEPALSYPHDPLRNISFGFFGDQRIHFDGEPTYHVPHVLLNQLSGVPQPVPGPEQLEQRYVATIAVGMGLVTPPTNR